MTATLAEALAREFANRLRAELTADEWHAMRQENLAYKIAGLSGVCASHNYRDANMIMLDAFNDVVTEPPAFLNPPDYAGTDHDRNVIDHSDEDLALWNAAWNIATRQHLTAKAEA